MVGADVRILPDAEEGSAQQLSLARCAAFRMACSLGHDYNRNGKAAAEKMFHFSNNDRH